MRCFANSGKLLSDGSMALKAAVLKNDATGWVQAVSGSTVNAAGLDNQGVWLLSSQAGGPASQVNVSGVLTNAGGCRPARTRS